ncbi:MAG TPA: HRDC domain-containing protein [Aggregatilineales bacterium]|nr:HRDC domain-containing protein [Aggregatilineales bacterium]
MQLPFPPATYIDHDKAFQKLLSKLRSEKLLAFDTESNSLYAYRERVCLIQLSTRKHDYILDPLRIADLSPLGDILANPAVEKVFHAAEYDLMCLKRDYGFTVANLFDTQIAARIGGQKTVGLDKLLHEHFGLTVDKSHQRDDWGERPLPEESLLYAQMDTHYLPQLRDILHAHLKAIGALHEATESFEDACNVTVPNTGFDPDGFWRLGIPAGLNKKQMAILRELYLLRDEFARERDVPLFKVFNDQVLIALSEADPTHPTELKQIRGMSAAQINRYGKPVLEAIKRGRTAPLPQQPPRPADIDPVVQERFALLRDWRRARAEQRGVESDVIISKDTLWTLAVRRPTTRAELEGIRGLGPWRLEQYGDDLLEMLRRNGR